MLSKLFSTLDNRKLGPLENLFNTLDTSNAMSTSPTIKKEEKKTEVPNKYVIKNRGLELTDDDIQEAKHILFSEISNRDDDKKSLEAKVILNTALNRMVAYRERGENKNLKEILQSPNQYQGYSPDGLKKGNKTVESQYQKSVLGKLDEPSKQKKQVVDSLVDELKNGDYEDNTNGAYYYTHDEKTGKITYDDKRPLFK